MGSIQFALEHIYARDFSISNTRIDAPYGFHIPQFRTSFYDFTLMTWRFISYIPTGVGIKVLLGGSLLTPATISLLALSALCGLTHALTAHYAKGFNIAPIWGGRIFALDMHARRGVLETILVASPFLLIADIDNYFYWENPCYRTRYY